MTATEQQVRMATKLYECRDAARSLLGDKYQKRMQDLGAALTKLAERKGCSVVDAAIDTAKGYEGFDVVQILAAAVELTEPSA
jgi:hypothetical protein